MYPISNSLQDLKNKQTSKKNNKKTPKNMEPISTFTQLLSSDLKSSELLYVHRDRTDRDVEPRTATSTFTQPLSSELYSCLLQTE